MTALLAVLIATPAWAGGSCETEAGSSLGDVSVLWVVPFAGLLLSIAIVPMVAGHWWHKNRNQLLVAVLWALPVLGYLLYLVVAGDDRLACEASAGLIHAIEEYISFIALLGSLFIISGGILLKGDLQGKPGVNTAFLAVGAVLANVIGTTGASMLLIQPMLRTNAERQHAWHIPLFFIFLVSNIGGALTPIGDPPLFLGYLRGVPFWWTLTNLWWIWLPTVGVLLGVFFALDTVMYRKEDQPHREADQAQIEPLGIEGSANFLLLAGVIVAVLFLSPSHGGGEHHQDEHGSGHGATLEQLELDGHGLAGSLMGTARAQAAPDRQAEHPDDEDQHREAGHAQADGQAPDGEHAAHTEEAEPGSEEHHHAAAGTGAGQQTATDGADPHGSAGHGADAHGAASGQGGEAWSLDPRDYFLREIVMALLAGLSLWVTSRRVRERDKFEYGPILEVAALFVGIFVAMVPATAMLQTHGASLGLKEPWQFFWVTGSLSAFLDNAPTYVTFASVACGMEGNGCETATNLLPLTSGESLPILMAISLGAVFLGAGSYIGNGPNFMVRAIAENYTMETRTRGEDGTEVTETLHPYKMPSFFGYIGYAALFLVPVFILVSILGLVLAV
jgi:Na+/H+ antiporter NhaD/arsenite permease-like protein